MKKKTLFVAAVFAALFIFLVFWSDIKTQVLFTKLRLNRKDTPIARSIADRLAKTKTGVRLCIKDIGVYGGGTQGWSSYVVKNNKLPDYTHEQLEMLVKRDVSLSQKVEAYILLWETQKDIGYLVKLYECIHTAASGEMALPAERGYGRNYLLKVFEKSPEAEAIFNKPSNEELKLTPEEFKVFAEQYFSKLQPQKQDAG